MGKKLGVGVLGCGNIAATYMRFAPMFRGIELRACADINPEAAQSRATEFGLRSESVAGLLAADDIDIIVNLTIPTAHFETSRAILQAGKHVYSEKPFVLSLKEGQQIAALADEKGLRVGAAPDTFLGGAHQLARHLLDDGRVGKITTGTAHMMSFGMEHWHPNPDFFFKAGAGPMLDLGPYYITNLVQLLGPVACVSAMVSTPRKRRKILSAPRAGAFIEVETPTSLHALLRFECGALITLGTSWDVQHHSHPHIELYGETGTLTLPDPNHFAGEVTLTDKTGTPAPSVVWAHPFLHINEPERDRANYRTAGLADMALAILEGRPHRCTQELALHVVEVMQAILRSGEEQRFMKLKTRCKRPAPLGPEAARALMV